MPTPIPLSELSDRVLLDSIAHAAADERHATVDLIRLLAELDARRLYLSEGCSSLFTYCTQVLHLSEHAAYHRIEAARASRAFPEVLDLLADGALTLTTVALLRAHLTAENHHELLAAARYKTEREVEDQIAGLAPRPDVKPLVRQVVDRPPSLDLLNPPADQTSAGDASEVAALPVVQAPLASVSPRSPGRYLLRVTISGETHLKLRQARDLLRHAIPDGDPAAILDRALTLLVQRLEREKAGMTSRPRASRRVHTRMEEGPQGRCRETGRLEFHHLVPFADGGPPEPSNISLRCRAHNSFESEQRFGPWSLTRS